MPSLAAAMAVNLLVWTVAYAALSCRTSSPFIYLYGLAAVSAIGAAALSDSFSLPNGDFAYVVVAPLVLTVVVTVRSAMSRRSSTK